MSSTTSNEAQAKIQDKSFKDKLSLIKAAMRDRSLSASAKNLLFVLVDHYNVRTSRCDPSLARLADEIGLSRRRAVAALRDLEAGGWVETTHTIGGRNSYSVVFEKAAPPHAGIGTTPPMSNAHMGYGSPVALNKKGTQKKNEGGIIPPPPPAFDLDIPEPLHDPGPPCAQPIRSVAKADEVEADFNEWFAQYPKREGRDGALREYRGARRRGATAAELLNGVLRFAAACQGKEARFITMPAYWLRDGRWRDDPPRQNQPQRPAPSRYAPRGLPPASVAQLAAMVAASKAKAAYEMALNGGKPLPAGGF